MLYDNVAEMCVEAITEVCSANYADVISENVLISTLPYLSVSKAIRYTKRKVLEKYKENFGNIDILYEKSASSHFQQIRRRLSVVLAFAVFESIFIIFLLLFLRRFFFFLKNLVPPVILGAFNGK